MSDLSKGNNSEANSSGTAAETNRGDLFFFLILTMGKQLKLHLLRQVICLRILRSDL